MYGPPAMALAPKGNEAPAYGVDVAMVVAVTLPPGPDEGTEKVTKKYGTMFPQASLGVAVRVVKALFTGTDWGVVPGSAVNDVAGPAVLSRRK